MERSAERIPLLARPTDALNFIYEMGRRRSSLPADEPCPDLGALPTHNTPATSANVTVAKATSELPGLQRLLSRDPHHCHTVSSASQSNEARPLSPASYETRVALTQEASLLARSVVARAIRAHGTPEQRYRRALVGLLPPTAHDGAPVGEATTSHAASATAMRSTDDATCANTTPAPTPPLSSSTTAMSEWPYTSLPDVVDAQLDAGEDAARRRLLWRYERCCALCHITPMPCVQGCLAQCEAGTGRPRWIAEVPTTSGGDTSQASPAAAAVPFVTTPTATTVTNASPTTSLATPTTTATAEQGLLSSSLSPQTTGLASDGAATTSSTVVSTTLSVALRTTEKVEDGGAKGISGNAGGSAAAGVMQMPAAMNAITEETASPCCRSSLNNDTLCACSSPSVSANQVPSSRPEAPQSQQMAQSAPCNPSHMMRLTLSVGHCVGVGRAEAFAPFLGMLEGAGGLHRLSLCHTDLENRSVCALVLLCQLYLPALHTLDLRDNPRLGDMGGLALRRLAATQPTLHAIRLEGTSVALRTEREIRQLLHHNRKDSHNIQDPGSTTSHTHSEHCTTLT